MNVLSVCDGIGAAHVAWHGLGWRPYVLSEIEAFPRAVLAHRHGAQDARHPVAAEAPLLWGDFTSLRERLLRRRGRSFAAVDLLAGGTPCQAFSVAGNRLSLADARGNLTLAYVSLANAIDAVRSRSRRPALWIVWENVPGVLSTRDNAFGAFLGGLVGSGAALQPNKGRTWPNAGVVHGPRRCAAWRVFDAQHFGVAQRRRRVIVVARGYFGGAGEWDGPDALLPLTESVSWHSAPCREARQDVAPTLGARPSSGGGQRDLDGGVVPTLTTTVGDVTRDEAGSSVVVYLAFAENSRAELRLEGGDGDTIGALKTGGGKPGQSFPAIAFNARQDPDSGAVTHPLDTDGSSISVCGSWGVRRLTPRECERLQGFPDDYTAIPFRGRMAADGPRYKALGNSWAVPKMAYVGERIAAVEAAREAERQARAAEQDQQQGAAEAAA